MSIESLLIVLMCTLIQSVFGVGILVFGTPILLSIGYDYFHVLGILLPSSLGVSVLQVLTLREVNVPETKILLVSGFGVVIGTALLSNFAVPVFVYGAMALAMLLAGMLRLSGAVQHKITKLLEFSGTYFYFFNAVFHGFANLGGVLLVLKNSVVYNQKNQSLMSTASLYLLYVLFQAVVLCIFGKMDIFVDGLIILPFAMVAHIFLGKKSFALLSQQRMDFSLGIFFVSVGIVLLYKFFVFF